MNKTILFTPVGGTDPISATNCYEGAMLHICRYYKPDKVIMYMSKEMLENKKTDNRYEYCLNELSKIQNRHMEYDTIERINLTNVHEFDFYYTEFRNIIHEILEKIDDTDTLLINVSSGTPAMKSGLLVLQTMEDFPAKLIQVSNPEKKIGEHIHKGYDVKTLWELNEDNEPGAENRCKEIKCPSLEKIKKEEIIKKHIQAYDYKAALTVVETMNVEDTSEFAELLEVAEKRLMLDFSGIDKFLKGRDYNFMPVRSSAERMIFEYALNLDIRLKKGEYADFIRALTPIIVELFELILKKQCKIDVNDYCYIDKKGLRKWSQEKLNNTEILVALNDAFMGNFKYGDVYSVHIKSLIERFTDNADLKKLVNDIREVEEKIRNDAAHDMISVTDKIVCVKTGYTSAQIMKMIHSAFNYTGINVKKEYWNSYDDMNRLLLSRI